MLVWMAIASRSGQAGGPCWPLSRGQASPTPPPLVLGTTWCPHLPRFLGKQEGEPGLTPTGGSPSLRVPWSGHRAGEQALFCWLACLLKKARPGELSTHVQGSPSLLTSALPSPPRHARGARRCGASTGRAGTSGAGAHPCWPVPSARARMQAARSGPPARPRPASRGASWRRPS